MSLRHVKAFSTNFYYSVAANYGSEDQDQLMIGKVRREGPHATVLI